jgi:hypothetical protein
VGGFCGARVSPGVGRMGRMTWWVPVLSFIGALAGAGTAGWVALRGQTQDARGEWRRRLDAAIELVTAGTSVERQIGDELLADLIESDLGSDEDRTLARRIARIRLGQQLGGGTATGRVDLALLPGDNGSVDEQEDQEP